MSSAATGKHILRMTLPTKSWSTLTSDILSYSCSMENNFFFWQRNFVAWKQSRNKTEKESIRICDFFYAWASFEKWIMKSTQFKCGTETHSSPSYSLQSYEAMPKTIVPFFSLLCKDKMNFRVEAILNPFTTSGEFSLKKRINKGYMWEIALDSIRRPIPLTFIIT